MYVYNLSELLNVLNDMKNDGFEYVDLSILSDEDTTEDTLYIGAIICDCESEDEMIDAVKLPDGYHL